MNDDLKAMGGKELLEDYVRWLHIPLGYGGPPTARCELLRRLEAGERAEAELKGLRENLDVIYDRGYRDGYTEATANATKKMLASNDSRLLHAESELKLAETTRESWRKEAEALEQEVEGLRAERDHHRVANEGLRARVAGHEALNDRLQERGAET